MGPFPGWGLFKRPARKGSPPECSSATVAPISATGTQLNLESITPVRSC